MLVNAITFFKRTKVKGSRKSFKDEKTSRLSPAPLGSDEMGKEGKDSSSESESEARSM